MRNNMGNTKDMVEQGQEGVSMTLSVEASVAPTADLGDESGVEEELEDLITEPFDPERIKIRTDPFLVEQIISRIDHKEIDLAPDFQRLSGFWDRQRKSRLIESLLLRIPLPVFYVAADEEDNWAVVDGVQRLSTIYEYVTDQFPLSHVEYLARWEGSKHSSLSRPMQRRISETKLVVNIIEPGTPQEVMYNVFFRINTGGVPLNGQEIRHALNPGAVRDYLEELSKSKEFIEATNGSVRPKRMADRECALRFLAFHIDPWEHYTSSDLNGYLVRAMRRINNMSESRRNEFASDFKKAMSAAKELFGKYAFRKRTKVNDRLRPISKALFESWSVQLARCSPEEVAVLIAQRKNVERRFIRLMKEDEEFDRSISYSTGSTQRVQKRFQAVQRLVEEFV